MTKEEMFNKNLRLAYKIANKYLINYKREHEDIKQVALIGLWKAVLTFNGNNAFSSYAYVVIKNEINYYLRSLRKNINTISLNKELFEGIYLENTIADNVNNIEKIEEEIDIKIYINKIRKSNLKEKHKKIFELSLKGLKQNEIANLTGCTQPQVSRVLKKLKKSIEVKNVRNEM